MSTELTTTQPPKLQNLVSQEAIRNKFKEILGKNAPAFISTMLSVVSNNTLLAKADPMSILNAAMKAAVLELPIDPNLGLAHIVPYAGKGQFQVGWRGFVEIALRTKRFSIINVTDVREGEIKNINRLTGEIEFEWLQEQDKRTETPLVGYVAYFRLHDGFSKYNYMTIKELKAHGVRYSQTMKSGKGKWIEDFDAMARKTVIKLLLSKWAPKSPSMQIAQLADQAVINDDGDSEYVDNKPALPEEIANEKERERLKRHIAKSESIEALEMCELSINRDDELLALYTAKKVELSGGKIEVTQKAEATNEVS